jgi:GNAT superfamily N-acetyltransferase
MCADPILATAADAAAIAAVRVAAADRLTLDFGMGHWSSRTDERSVLRELTSNQIIIVRSGDDVVGTASLQRKKPWAIDLAYFTACGEPIYLINMAVHPGVQRRGIGRALLDHALELARAGGADAIRLDAYDGLVGAGEFYRKCGYQLRGGKTYRKVPLLYFERMIGVAQ